MSVGAFGDAVVLAMKASSVLLALTDVSVTAIASVVFTASDASSVLLEVPDVSRAPGGSANGGVVGRRTDGPTPA